MRTIRNIIRVDISDLGLELGIQAGSWLLAEIIVFAVVHLASDVNRVPSAGTAAVVYGAAFCMAITNTVRFIVEYRMHLCFPLSRRGVLLGHLAAMLAHNAVLAAGALVWAGAGAVLHPLLYAGTGLPCVPTFAYTPWFAWLILLLAPQLVAVLFGGIIVRFGRFPHRNAALGRPSTREEIEFLRQPVFAEIAPGVPMPTRQRAPARASSAVTSSTMLPSTAS